MRQKRKGKRKKTGQKRLRRRVQRRPEKGSISSFPSRSAILDPSSFRQEDRQTGTEDETSLMTKRYLLKKKKIEKSKPGFTMLRGLSAAGKNYGAPVEKLS